MIDRLLFARYQKGYCEPIAPSGWTPCTFRSRSGATLCGLLCSGTDGMPAVVCAHPMSRSAKGFFLKTGQADYLRQQGYPVLFFDFQGFGGSSRGNCDFPADVISAGEYFRDLTGRAVWGLGVSFGAAWLLCASAREHPFSGLLLEAPFANLADYWGRYPFRHAMLQAFALRYPDRFLSHEPLVQAPRVQHLEHLSLLYGDRDNICRMSFGLRLYSCLAQHTQVPLQFHVLRGAEHCKGFQQSRSDYETCLSVLSIGLS